MLQAAVLHPAAVLQVTAEVAEVATTSTFMGPALHDLYISITSGDSPLGTSGCLKILRMMERMIEMTVALRKMDNI